MNPTTSITPKMLHGYRRGPDNLYRKSVQIEGSIITIVRKPDGHLFRTEDRPIRVIRAIRG